MPTALAVVPARGGSRGISRKNVTSVGGRPLVAWTITAALEATASLRVIVSTDDEDIAAVARSHGAEVPFLRPAELATDSAGSDAPTLHAVEWVIAHGWRPDLVMCLQPTSPLRTAEDIEGAIEALEARGADSLVSVTPAHPHPYWVKSLDADGCLLPFLEGVPAIGRRQELPPAYALNGAIFLVRTDAFLRERRFYAGRTCGYVMPPERSLDIDTPWDLHLADLVLRARTAGSFVAATSAS